jgi:hypothetical protein
MGRMTNWLLKETLGDLEGDRGKEILNSVFVQDEENQREGTQSESDEATITQQKLHESQNQHERQDQISHPSSLEELLAFVKEGAQIIEYGPRATPKELARAPKGAESMMFRRPILYDSLADEIHIGKPGEYHDALFKRGLMPNGGMYYGSETIHPEETGIQFYNPQPPQQIKEQVAAHTGLPLLGEGGFFAKAGGFHYHVAPQENRDSIEQHGLKQSDIDQTHIWMFDDAELANEMGKKGWGPRGPNDVWEINTEGLQLQPDPHPGWSPPSLMQHSWAATEPISPERLRRLAVHIREDMDEEDLEGWEGGQWDGRRPFIYHPPSNTVYVGQPNTGHVQLNEIMETDLGPHPDPETSWSYAPDNLFGIVAPHGAPRPGVAWFSKERPAEVSQVLADHFNVPIAAPDAGNFFKAKVALNPGPTYYYHTSPSRNRSGIEQFGLKANWDPEVDDEPGVFMTSQEPQVERANQPGPQDIWRVDVSGLPVKPDPWGEDYSPPAEYLKHEGYSWYFPQDIEPSRVQLHRPEISLITSKVADSWDTRQYQDQASDPLPATHYDHEKDCTCEEGHKLDCPVHGLYAEIDQGDKPLRWTAPETSPVGYPQDQPRAWQTPYTGSWHVAGIASQAEMVPIEALEPYMEFNRAPGEGEAAANPEYWQMLKDHIAQNGFEDPLTIEYNPSEGTAKLGEGNHRLGIAKELGLTHVPVSGMVTYSGPNMVPLQTSPTVEPDEYGYFPGSFTPSTLGLPVAGSYQKPSAYTWQEALKPYYDKFRQATWHLNPPHYNRWTGELCHCPWSSEKRKMTRLAGEHMNKVLKTYQKAFQTPQGEQFLHNIQSEIPEEYESLLPYIVNRWRKGDIKPDSDHENRLVYTANPRWPERTLLHHRLPSWHKWFEARQHPTRRGVDVMAKDFTPDKMDFRAQEHEQALQEQREQEVAKAVGKTVWHVPERPGGIDWDEVYQDQDYGGVVHFPSYDEDDPQITYNRLKPSYDRLNKNEDMDGYHPISQEEIYELERLEDNYSQEPRPKGWHIKHLTANVNDRGEDNDPDEALECEGGLMDHYIGSEEQPYRKLANQGKIEAYSLRDPKGMPHVTWHYNSDGSLAEIYGHEDSEVKPEYQEMLNEWANNGGLATENPYGTHERVGAEYIEFPQARDVNDYLAYHHPTFQYETAENYDDYDPEETEIRGEEPDWESIAHDYYNNFLETPTTWDRPWEKNHYESQKKYFHEGLAENSYNHSYNADERELPIEQRKYDQGHYPEFHRALNEVLKEEEEPSENAMQWGPLSPEQLPPQHPGQQAFSKKAAQRWQEWQPGNEGKWAKEKDGKILAWRSYADGWPHHFEMVMPENHETGGRISPAGVVSPDDPQTPLAVLEEVAKQHPALNVPEADFGGFFSAVAAPNNDDNSEEEKTSHTWSMSQDKHNVKGALNPSQQPLGWPWEINTPVQDVLLGRQGVIRDINEPQMKAFVQWEGPGLNGSWTNATSLQPRMAGLAEHQRQEEESEDNGPKPEPPEPYIYHVAPTVDRERIKAHGLRAADPSAPFSGWPFNPGGAPKGVYGHPYIEDAEEYKDFLEEHREVPHDIWQIPVENHIVRQDPDIKGAYYIPEHVTDPDLLYPVEQHRFDWDDTEDHIPNWKWDMPNYPSSLETPPEWGIGQLST